MPRVSVKIIKEVINNRVGSDALDLIMALKAGDELSEFDLAKLIKEDINRVRNKLYRLQHLSLISYTKKKDEEKGWYVYFWSLRPESFNLIYKEIQDQKLSRLNEELKSKGGNDFFECINDCGIVSEVNALSTNYACPDCGELLKKSDNSKELEQIQKKRKRLKKSMEKCS